MSFQPTFLNIKNDGKLVEDNEFFQQYTNNKIPHALFANFVLLKYTPSLSEFKIIEKMHKEYQLDLKQKFLNFYWPENTGLDLALLEYFNTKNYKIGMQNLYVLATDSFKINRKQTIAIEKVSKKSLPIFLEINYQEDLLEGEKYAIEQEMIYKYQFSNKDTQFFLAKINNVPVASMMLHSSKYFLELDHLLTLPKYRKQGIATQLIQFTIHLAKENKQKIILVADAEDSVKNMYENMGFQYISYQINAQKELKINP